MPRLRYLYEQKEYRVPLKDRMSIGRASDNDICVPLDSLSRHHAIVSRDAVTGAFTLSDNERVVLEQHPVLGEELAAFVHNLKAVGPVIRAHHERVDGQGYPDGLRGDAIPWLARLLAVAVSYASSPYQTDEAIEIIKHGAGTMFDPDAVRAFVRVLPQTPLPRRERELMLTELRPGMVLAKGIYTSSGMLLLPDGEKLNDLNIEKLRNHNRINAITQSLVVSC